MHTSNSDRVMPNGRPTARRAGVIGLASVITAGLILGPGIAQPASAAPASGPAATVGVTATTVTGAKTATLKTAKTVKKSKVKVRVNKKTFVKGKKGAKLTIRVSVSGKKAAGIVKIYDGKKKLRTVKAKKGRASYTLPKNLKAKKHTIKVKFIPSGAAKKNIKPSAAKLRVKVLTKGQMVAKVAKKYVGVKYRTGGRTPKGFDCSGFTSYVYKKAGVKKLSPSSSAQRHAGKVVSRSKAKVGDLIWSPGHVAIYLGGNKQIDAPRPGKTIQVRSIWQSNPKFIRV